MSEQTAWADQETSQSPDSTPVGSGEKPARGVRTAGSQACPHMHTHVAPYTMHTHMHPQPGTMAGQGPGCLQIFPKVEGPS